MNLLQLIKDSFCFRFCDGCWWLSQDVFQQSWAISPAKCEWCFCWSPQAPTHAPPGQKAEQEWNSQISHQIYSTVARDPSLARTKYFYVNGAKATCLAVDGPFFHFSIQLNSQLVYELLINCPEKLSRIDWHFNCNNLDLLSFPALNSHIEYKSFLFCHKYHSW